MYSLIYLKEDIKNLDNYNVKLTLGGDKWKIVEDKNNCFSMGEEIIYNYKKNGIYKFFLVFTAYSDIWGNGLTTLKINGTTQQTCFYRDNIYYGKLICVVQAKQGNSTNFQLEFLNSHGKDRTTPLNIKGDSSNYNFTFLEVQYMGQEIIEEPIIITEDSKITLNRRHIVKAPLLKTINLTLEDNASINDWVEVKNMDLGNFQINTGDNTQIMLNSYMTKEKTGYIKSKKRGDFVRLECMETDPKIIFTNTNTVGTFGILQ